MIPSDRPQASFHLGMEETARWPLHSHDKIHAGQTCGLTPGTDVDVGTQESPVRSQFHQLQTAGLWANS